MAKEYGYLGSVDVGQAKGTNGVGVLSRTPTLNAAGEPVYTPAGEEAWARELMASDGRFRFMKSGYASGRGAGNALDAILADNFTVLMLYQTRNANYSAPVRKLLSGTTLGFQIQTAPRTVNTGTYFRSELTVGVGTSAYAPAARKVWDRNWHWFSASRGSPEVRVSLDGAFQTTNIGNGTVQNTEVLTLNPSTGDNLACIMIYSRVLSDAEIQNIMSGAAMPKTVAGLAAYYKFNDASGTVCTDHSGNGHHLTYSADVSTLTETYAPNLAANGTFDTDSLWTEGDGWSIFNGKATAVATGASKGLQQFMGFSAGTRYRVTLDYTCTAGTAIVYRGQGSQKIGITIDSIGSAGLNGKFVGEVTCSASAEMKLLIQADAAFVGTIDNIVVQELGGRNGQPYVPRPRLLQTNWWDRKPSAKVAAEQQGSYYNTTAAVSVPNHALLQITGDISIVGWIKRGKSIGGTHTVFSKQDAGTAAEGRLDLSEDGRAVRFYRGGNVINITLAKFAPVGVWLFVGITHADGIATAFVNALPVGATPFTPTVTAGAANAMIGAFATGRVATVRSVRVFNRAISQAEVEELFQNDSITNRSGLVGEWLCNEVWNNRVLDTSGNTLHSTVITGPTFVLDSPYALLRRKREGKQLRVVGAGNATCYNSTILKGLLTGSRYVTTSCWIKPVGMLKNASSRFGVETSAANAGMIIGGSSTLEQAATFARSSNTDASQSLPSTNHAAARGVLTLYSAEVDYTAKTLKLYMNGVLIKTTGGLTFGGNTYSDAGNPSTRVGNVSTDSTLVFDDCRIWSRALTPAEHRALFLDQAPRDGLVAEYLFDNDTVNCQDTSGNGLHATWNSITAANYVQEG